MNGWAPIVDGEVNSGKAENRQKGGTKLTTLPKTNIAGWKIHHFDGIYKETWGFSWANC